MEKAATAQVGRAPDVPHTGHSSISPNTTVAHLRSGPDPAPLQPPFPPGSIGACCMEFIQKIHATFGEHSQQRATILQVLYNFKIGQWSKRKTHLTMSQALSTHENLQNHLLDILDHPDARWGPGDFVFPQTVDPPPTGAAMQNLPDYMEPQHRPQLPLPYTSPEWITTPQSGFAQPTSSVGNSTDLPYISMPQLSTYDAMQIPRHDQNHGYDGYDRYGNSTHLPYIQNENVPWDSFAPGVFPFPDPSPSNEFNHPTEFSSPNYDNAGPFPNNTWPGNGVETLPVETCHHQSGSYFMPAENRTELNTTSHTHETAESPSTYHRADSSTTLAPISQLVDNRKTQCDPGVSADSGLDQIRQYADWTATDQSISPKDIKPAVSPREASTVEICSPKSSSVASHPIPQQDKVNRFIHGICGQSFRTRFGVKKHHWGTNLEDVNTTSGCWHKHGKPDRTWNEHPSCEYDGPKPRAKSRSKASEPKAPVVPSMIPSSERLFPSVPPPKDLPGTVAGLVNSAPAVSECSEPNELRPLASRDQQGMASLLSAVDVISQPDGGRNDSLSLASECKASPTSGNGQSGYSSWIDRDDGRYAYPVPVLRSQQLTEDQMKSVGVHTTQAENDGYASPSMMVESTGNKGGRKRGRSIKKEKENMCGSSTVAEANEKKRKI